MAAVRGITGVLNGLGVSGANLTSGSWSLPSGWVPGDLAVFVWYSRESGRTFTPPGTITQKVQTSSAGFGHLYIGYRFLVAGDTTFSWSATSSTNNTDGYYTVIFQDAASSGDPFERSSGANATTFSNTQSPNPPAITAATVLDKDTVITVFGKNNDVASSVTAPTGYGGPGLGVGNLIQGFEDTSGTDGSSGLAQKPNIAAGTTEDPAAWTLGGASTDDGMQWTGAIRSSVRDTLTADAVIRKTQSNSFTTNAVIKATVTGSPLGFIGSTSNTSASTTSLSLTVPADAEAGDLLVVSVVAGNGTQTWGSTPGGWNSRYKSEPGPALGNWVLDRIMVAGDTSVAIPISPAASVTGAMAAFRRGGIAFQGLGTDQNDASNATTLAITAQSSTSTFGAMFDLLVKDNTEVSTGQARKEFAATGNSKSVEGWTRPLQAWPSGGGPVGAITWTSVATFRLRGPIYNWSSSGLVGNAVIRKTGIAGSFTANAVIFRTQASSFTANAFIPGRFTANAYIDVASISGSFTANAVIKRTTRSPLVWTQRTDLSNDGEGVLYANGMFIAESTQNFATSSDGVTWALTTAPDSGSDEAYGAGNWVVTGEAGVWATTDPTSGSWTNVLSVDSFTAVAFDGTFWVAAGANGSLYYATDPFGSWTQQTSHPFGVTAISVVRFANGLWVAVDTTGITATTTNPTTAWTQRDTFGGAPYVLRYRNGLWMVGGESGGLARIGTMADPTSGTWAEQALPMRLVTAIYWDSARGWFLGGRDVPNTAGAMLRSDDAASWVLDPTIGALALGSGLLGIDSNGSEMVVVLGFGQVYSSANLSLNAVVKRTISGSLTGGAIISRTQSGSFTADAVVLRTQAVSFTANAVIKATVSSSFTANTITRRTQAGTLSADAIIKRTQTGSTSADAVIVRTQTGSFTANAVILRPASGSFTADADIKATSAGSLTVNAFISGHLSLDAVTLRTFWFGDAGAGF